MVSNGEGDDPMSVWEQKHDDWVGNKVCLCGHIASHPGILICPRCGRMNRWNFERSRTEWEEEVGVKGKWWGCSKHYGCIVNKSTDEHFYYGIKWLTLSEFPWCRNAHRVIWEDTLDDEVGDQK